MMTVSRLSQHAVPRPKVQVRGHIFKSGTLFLSHLMQKCRSEALSHCPYIKGGSRWDTRARSFRSYRRIVSNVADRGSWKRSKIPCGAVPLCQPQRSPRNRNDTPVRVLLRLFGATQGGKPRAWTTIAAGQRTDDTGLCIRCSLSAALGDARG